MPRSRPPKREVPDPAGEHYDLRRNVREAIASLPAYFRSQTVIAGIMATDLHTLNSVLGAAIEEQVVSTLNSMRLVWDPHERYALYSFVRQAQTFPDVLLKRLSDGDILLGIELKGWYLLAKEGEPSFRYQVTPAACAPQDLIVVVPWALAHVLSGSPLVLDPYIESAFYAAAFRNYWWEHVRESNENRSVHHPTGVTPYPTKSDAILDQPAYDRGGNFGRFARTGIMDEYLGQMKARLLGGVKIEHWLMFLKAFQGDRDEQQILAAIRSLRERILAASTASAPITAPALSILDELQKLLGL